jgi:hypothetical protein
MSPICSFLYPSHVYVCTLLLFGCGSFLSIAESVRHQRYLNTICNHSLQHSLYCHQLDGFRLMCV